MILMIAHTKLKDSFKSLEDLSYLTIKERGII